jgi:hypothetical protein
MLGGTQKTRWRTLAALVIAAAAGIAVWQVAIRATQREGPSANSIMVIAPYWYNGTWVFDDPAVGLKREPFVAGVPEMIDALVKDIPDSREGFRLLFSANAFPGHQKTLTWVRGDSLGNYYRLDDPPVEGWICPALFKYYKTPPKSIYVKAEPTRR